MQTNTRVMKHAMWKLLAAAALMLLVIAMPLRSSAANDTYTVKVDSGYLALRTAKAYDASNEIGKLYTGETVQVLDTSDSQYWYVYSSKYNAYGYVNCDYLISNARSTWTVRVESGYLALRTAKAYDYANEIGKLYTGDTVYVYDNSDSQYWYVYSPDCNKFGYVNCDYLYGGSNITLYSLAYASVRVESGYLALRTAKAYDYTNEIGELYTGEYIWVLDDTDSQYWYVYAPSLDKAGYVNCDYLVNITYIESKCVRVESGYLALRTAKAYDAANEIGKLYTGECVWVLNTSDSQYWYVYAPSLDKAGYVNKDYLI